MLTDYLRLDYNDATAEYSVKNIATETVPSILHGNGPHKVLLNNFGSYIAGAFKHKECQLCKENLLPEFSDPEKMPTVSLALFIEKATPFLEEYFDSIAALEYPKKKISLFVHNNVRRLKIRQGTRTIILTLITFQVQYHHDVVTKFVESFGDQYANVKQILHSDKTPEATARNLAVSYAERQASDYLFVIDADAHLDDVHTLTDLIRQNQ